SLESDLHANVERLFRRAIARHGALLKMRLIVLELQLREVVHIPIDACCPRARSSGRLGWICKTSGESCLVDIQFCITRDEFPGANAGVIGTLKAFARN